MLLVAFTFSCKKSEKSSTTGWAYNEHIMNKNGVVLRS